MSALTKDNLEKLPNGEFPRFSEGRSLPVRSDR